MSADIPEDVREIDAVRAENERMRSALEEIYERGLYRQSGYKDGFYASFKTARRALRIPHMTFDEALAKLERERQSRG
jgi:hypothetical protein